MTKILYFDCFAGVGGDMIVGALLDLGLELSALEAGLSCLALDGYRLESQRVERAGIQAVQFKVILENNAGDQLADAEFVEVDRTAAAAPEMNRPQHAHGRGLADILAILNDSALPDTVKSRSGQVFSRLAQAEGQVHGQPPGEVHFHEVGSLDAIIDITAACLGLEILGIEEVYASPLHLGGGFVRSQHGLLPVPAPATAALLSGLPVYTSQIQGELVTPTGAAVLSTLASGFGDLPPMRLQRAGYGAGSRQREFPNVLRAFLGERLSMMGDVEPAVSPRLSRDPHPEQHDAPAGPAGYHEGQAVAIEANLDDMNPQLFENLVEKLLAAGALDVLLIPAQMKKNRPAVLLHVLANPDSVDALCAIIFRESTTLGLRTFPVSRRMLRRELIQVETGYGSVAVKLGWLGERMVNIAPEYEDCHRLAESTGVPLKEILAAASAAARLQHL